MLVRHQYQYLDVIYDSQHYTRVYDINPKNRHVSTTQKI